MSDNFKDMDPREFRKAVSDLRAAMGIKADILVSLHDYTANKNDFRYTNFTAHVYLKGLTKGLSFAEEGDSLTAVLDELNRKWADFQSEHEQRTIREMALAIIRITADLGECTDAALRNVGEFDPGQIRAYGERSCIEANDIAGRGPFKITVKGGANCPEEAV